MVELQAKQIDHSSHTSSHHQSSPVLPCVVGIIVTAVVLNCSSLLPTLKYHCNDFPVGCLCSISAQQRLGIARRARTAPEAHFPIRRPVPRMAAAQNASQLSAPISDRAPQVQIAMSCGPGPLLPAAQDYIQRYHVTSISWHITLNNHASTRPQEH